eukprot:3536598-Rhodomonas_salina.1
MTVSRVLSAQLLSQTFSRVLAPADLFGNYVVQKFMERGTPEHRAMLAQAMQGKVLELSLDMYGCRVVQKAIEVVEHEQQEQLVWSPQRCVVCL